MVLDDQDEFEDIDPCRTCKHRVNGTDSDKEPCCDCYAGTAEKWEPE